MKLHCILLFLVPFVSFAQTRMPIADCPNQSYRIVSNFNQEKWKENDPVYFGITDTVGNELLPFLYDQIFPMRHMTDTCGNLSAQFIVTEGTHQFVFDAKTNRKSTKHSYIIYTGEQYLFQDSTQWGVLDSSFNTIITGIPGTPATSASMDYFYEFGMEHALYYSSYFLYEDIAFQKKYVLEKNWLTEWPEVLLYKKAVTPNQKVETYWDPSISFQGHLFGLFHTQDKKLIPAIYHDVHYRYMDKQLYYWCTKFERYNLPLSKNSYQGELHIYDQSLNLIKKIPFRTNPPDNLDLDLEQYTRFSKSSPKIYPLENKKRRFGAIDARGTTILPFEYDSITLAIDPWRIPLLKTVKDHKVQLLNDTGAVFIKGMYEDLHVIKMHYEIWIVAKTASSKASWHVISPEGKQSADGFEKLFYDDLLIYHLDIPYEYRANDHPIFCGITDNNLYLITHNASYLCDTSRFHFKNETFGLKQVIINKSGRIIYTGKQVYTVSDFGYVDINSGCTTFISMDGKQLLEADLFLKEIDWNTGLVCLNKNENEYITFDLKNWRWLED